MTNYTKKILLRDGTHISRNKLPLVIANYVTYYIYILSFINYFLRSFKCRVWLIRMLRYVYLHFMPLIVYDAYMISFHLNFQNTVSNKCFHPSSQQNNQSGKIHCVFPFRVQHGLQLLPKHSTRKSCLPDQEQ